MIWLVLFFSTLEGDQTTSRLGLKEITEIRMEARVNSQKYG